MNNFAKIIALIIAGFLVLTFFIDESSDIKESTLNSSTALDGMAKHTYGMRAADNTWPAIDQAESVQSDNLGKKNYYLVFDGSGSMSERQCAKGQSKIDVAKSAVIGFINKIPADANIGLATFDVSGISERVLLGGGNKENAIAQVRRIQAGGGTPLSTSIGRAYSALTTQAVKQLGYGEYHLVVITDGEATSGEDPKNVVRTLLNQSPVVVHTIGFCIGSGHSLNQAGYTFYKSANNPEQLAMGLESVLAEAPDFVVTSFEGQAP
jgi:Ca-activated chloride channel homolog